MPRRRTQPDAMTLEQMTDKELRAVYFFGTHPTYAVGADDARRARAILEARGYFQRTDGPEAA